MQQMTFTSEQIFFFGGCFFFFSNFSWFNKIMISVKSIDVKTNLK